MKFDKAIDKLGVGNAKRVALAAAIACGLSWDDEHKIVDREENTGIKVFKWNGKKFVEVKGKGMATRTKNE